jgi:hypothetical protein
LQSVFGVLQALRVPLGFGFDARVSSSLISG